MPLAPAVAPPEPAVLPPEPALTPPAPDAVVPAPPLKPPLPDVPLMPAPPMPALATPAEPATDTPPAPDTLATPAVVPVMPAAALLSPAVAPIPLVLPMVPAAPRPRKIEPSPPVPVAGGAAVHIVASYVQVTGSQSKVPELMPTVAHVAPPRFVGSQGITPRPHAALGVATAGFTVDPDRPAAGLAGGGSELPHAATTAASSAASQAGNPVRRPGALMDDPETRCGCCRVFVRTVTDRFT